MIQSGGALGRRYRAYTLSCTTALRCCPRRSNENGGAIVCLETGEGHDVVFYSGTLHLGCTTMSGSIAQYGGGGRFALTRALPGS